MDGYNLLLGVVAALLWAGALVRWFGGAELGQYAAGAFVVAIATVCVILIFGSLRLLNVLSDDLWNLVGTGGRGLFALCAVVVLLDSHHPSES